MALHGDQQKPEKQSRLTERGEVMVDGKRLETLWIEPRRPAAGDCHAA